MKYIVRFEMGFAKNRCLFDDKEDAIKFAKHIKCMDEIKGISLHSVDYDYDATVEANK